MGLFDFFKRQPHSRVHMTMSAAEYVAGQTYDLPIDLADSFIAKGYAMGTFSRHYDEAELAMLRADSQRINLDG